MKEDFKFDGLIFETFYVSGTLPKIYGLYENDGIVTKTLIYEETGTFPTNTYVRKEILLDYQNLLALVTEYSGFGSPAIYGHTVVHYGKLANNNRLFKIATMGVIAACDAKTFLYNKPNFNNVIYLPGFATRTDFFNGLNYFGFPSAVIGATNFIDAITSFTTPAGCSSLTINFYMHNVGGVSYLAYTTDVSVTASTFYNLVIVNAIGTNLVTTNVITAYCPLPEDLFMSSFRIEVIPNVGSLTPSSSYYNFNKFLSFCSRS